MALAEGRAYGRSKIGIDQAFIEAYQKWRKKEVMAVEAMKMAGMKKNTWYNRVKEYEAVSCFEK